VGKIFVLSSGRVGSNWLVRMLCEIFKKDTIFYEPRTGELLSKFLLLHSDKVIKAHLPHMQKLSGFLTKDDKVIGITRNLFDVIASVVNITLANEIRVRGNNSCSLKEAKERCLTNESLDLIVREWVESKYYCGYNFKQVVYEELVKSPVDVMSNVIEFIGTPVDISHIKASVRKQNLKNKPVAVKEWADSKSSNIITRGTIGQSQIILTEKDTDVVKKHILKYILGKREEEKMII